MGGVYGDMLLHFREQFRDFYLFQMNPKINGGWDIVADNDGKTIYTTISGILQDTRGDAIKESNGNLVETDGRELWTRTKGLAGYFLDFDGITYRLIDSSKWDFEGGFFRYGLQKVVGNNATQSDQSAWNLGENSFG